MVYLALSSQFHSGLVEYQNLAVLGLRTGRREQ